MKTLKLSAAFRKAAEQMDMWAPNIITGMCSAAINSAPRPQAEDMLEILREHKLDAHALGPWRAYWGANVGSFDEDLRSFDPEQMKQGRVLFLLFLSEMLKSEGR